MIYIEKKLGALTKKLVYIYDFSPGTDIENINEVVCSLRDIGVEIMEQYIKENADIGTARHERNFGDHLITQKTDLADDYDISYCNIRGSLFGQELLAKIDCFSKSISITYNNKDVDLNELIEQNKHSL